MLRIWMNLLGIRVKNKNQNKIYEFPLFPLKKTSKSWITWVNNSEGSEGKEGKEGNEMLVFDQLQNSFLTYDESGSFLKVKNIGDEINTNLFA